MRGSRVLWVWSVFVESEDQPTLDGVRGWGPGGGDLATKSADRTYTSDSYLKVTTVLFWGAGLPTVALASEGTLLRDRQSRGPSWCPGEGLLPWRQDGARKASILDFWVRAAQPELRTQAGHWTGVGRRGPGPWQG